MVPSVHLTNSEPARSSLASPYTANGAVLELHSSSSEDSEPDAEVQQILAISSLLI